MEEEKIIDEFNGELSENEVKLAQAWSEMDKAVQEKDLKKAMKMYFWIKSLIKQKTIVY